MMKLLLTRQMQRILTFGGQTLKEKALRYAITKLLQSGPVLTLDLYYRTTTYIMTCTISICKTPYKFWLVRSLLWWRWDPTPTMSTFIDSTYLGVTRETPSPFTTSGTMCSTRHAVGLASLRPTNWRCHTRLCQGSNTFWIKSRITPLFSWGRPSM